MKVLEQHSTNFSANERTNPIIARPFYNVGTNREDAELIAYPNVALGSLAIQATTEFGGAEVILRKRLACECWFHIDGTIGYQYARLEDNLRFGKHLVSLDSSGPAAPGTTIDCTDQFDARNEFNSGGMNILAQQ